MLNHEEYIRKVLSSRNPNGTLKSRESFTVEFKESFNKANIAKYAKAMAAYSNNRGGYIIFGVKDNPRLIAGLKNNNFDNLNQEQFSEAVNSLFAPVIEWESGTFSIEVTTADGETISHKIGWIYTSEAEYKPIIAQKNITSKFAVINSKYSAYNKKLPFDRELFVVVLLSIQSISFIIERLFICCLFIYVFKLTVPPVFKFTTHI